MWSYPLSADLLPEMRLGGGDDAGGDAAGWVTFARSVEKVGCLVLGHDERILFLPFKNKWPWFRQRDLIRRMSIALLLLLLRY